MKEVKVVSFILVSIISFIVGYVYFCKINIFKNNKQYYFYINDCSKINDECNINLNGMKVGSVKNLKFDFETLTTKVTVVIDARIKVLENSEIEVNGIDMLYKNLTLNLNDGDVLKNNSQIKVVDNTVRSSDLLKNITNIVSDLSIATGNIKNITKNLNNEIKIIKDERLILKLTKLINKTYELVNSVKIPWIFRK